jgi:hypothetical protein
MSAFDPKQTLLDENDPKRWELRVLTRRMVNTTPVRFMPGLMSTASKEWTSKRDMLQSRCRKIWLQSVPGAKRCQRNESDYTPGQQLKALAANADAESKARCFGEGRSGLAALSFSHESGAARSSRFAMADCSRASCRRYRNTYKKHFRYRIAQCFSFWLCTE